MLHIDRHKKPVVSFAECLRILQLSLSLATMPECALQLPSL